MRTRILASVCSAVALALLMQIAPSSATTPADHPRTAHAYEPPADNLAAQQLGIWDDLPVEVWHQALEEHCIEKKSDAAACTMTEDDVDDLLPDVEKLTADLGRTVKDHPDLVEGVNGTGNDRSVRAPGTLVGATVKVAKASKNKAVRALANQRYADRISDFTDEVGKISTAHDGLTSSTVEDFGKVVVGSMPLLGDAFSLASAVGDGDVEAGIVAVISLAGTMIATVCAPAGVAIAASLLVYELGKKIFGWLCSGSRDWRLEPPGNPAELFAKGASIGWESHAGTSDTGDRAEKKRYAVQLTQFTKTKYTKEDHLWAHAKLVLDSRWSKAMDEGKNPVDYTVTDIDLHGLQGLVNSVTFKSWQDGVERNADCRMRDATNYANGQSITCHLRDNERLTIGKNKPAIVKIDYNYLLNDDFKRKPDTAYDRPWYCDPDSGPCVPAKTDMYKSEIRIETPDTKKWYRVPVPFGYGFVSDLPGATVEHLK
ncbi:hypothetical protein [Streptomyces sp. NPDC088785]|uniref:hypothetical protein n=1 Tax=Streptomyces sp. NPDC088785 TaxID=3365897 RepID=UPI0037FF677C